MSRFSQSGVLNIRTNLFAGGLTGHIGPFSFPSGPVIRIHPQSDPNILRPLGYLFSTDRSFKLDVAISHEAFDLIGGEELVRLGHTAKSTGPGVSEYCVAYNGRLPPPSPPAGRPRRKDRGAIRRPFRSLTGAGPSRMIDQSGLREGWVSSDSVELEAIATTFSRDTMVLSLLYSYLLNSRNIA